VPLLRKAVRRRWRQSRDHVPSKALVREPYPPNLSAVQVCVDCNNGFSADEQYFAAFIGCVLAGATTPGGISDPRTRRILEENPGLRARIQRARHEPVGSSKSPLWEPEAARIINVLTKNARGHLWFECEQIERAAPAVGFAALETLDSKRRIAFESRCRESVLPEVGTRLLDRTLTGRDMVDDWVVVQEGIYRFNVDLDRNDGSRARIVLAEYLAAEIVWRGEENEDREASPVRSHAFE
jgi:hypothetical protein